MAAAIAVGAAVGLVASGAQAAGTPGWRFAEVYPQVDQMLSVSASSAANAWAVGQTSDLRLFVSHWNGRKWQTLPEPTDLPFSPNGVVVGAAVAATAGQRAWVFVSRENDELGTSEVDAVEWNGTSWTAAHGFGAPPDPGAPIASGPDDVWGFGSGNGTAWAVHFNGKGWSRISIPVSGSAASGSAAAGDWVTGTVAAQPTRVAVLHWSRGAWRNVALPKISVPKGKQMLPGLIAAATPASVWATVRVGPPAGPGSVTTILLHWNGKAWSKVSVPKGVNVDGLASDGHGGFWVASPTFGKSPGLVTGLVMYHYSGGRWTHVQGPARRGWVTSLGGGNMQSVPGTRSVLENAILFSSHGFDGAILKYGP